jgi:diguanylate cyclase (GGDEF)-like protein
MRPFVPALALDAIIVDAGAERVAILSAVEITNSAAGGKILRFALINDSKTPLMRILATPNLPVMDSGLFWPFLGGPRLVSLKVQKGNAALRRLSLTRDIFSITLEPGKTEILIARTPDRLPPELYIWNPDSFTADRRRSSFFQGLLLGISGLLAIFLSSLYIIRRQIMFPAAALVSWAGLLVLASEFGLLSDVFRLGVHGAQIVRAMAELLLVAGLAVLFYVFLELVHRISRARYAILAGAGILPVLLAVSVLSPPASGAAARLAMIAITYGGMGYLVYLAMHGANRAQTLLPAWIWLAIWTGLAILAQTGVLNATLAGPLYSAGLVLMVMLLAFTVIQYAFGSDLPMEDGVSNRTGLNAVAFATTGLGVWDWDVLKGRIKAGAEVERRLDLRPGSLDTDEETWADYIHSNDRDRFEAKLQNVTQHPDRWLEIEFRMRRSDGVYRWFRLTARPVMRDQGEAARMIGALQDITAEKNSEERLLHDAVHDSLTGLPNRALFKDRLERAIERTKAKIAPPPGIAVVDFDRFQNINDAFGHAAGDSLLLVMARRLERCIELQDTLARLSGDDFAMILTGYQNREELEELVKQVTKTVSAPIQVNNREVFLTASVGLSIYNGKQRDATDLLKEAEIAMSRAKSIGAGRIEFFKPSMRSERKERFLLESDLRHALERHEIEILYQPVVALADESLAGFEALVRWQHPDHGELAPKAFLNIAEETGLIIDLGRFVLDTAARQLGTWQRAFSQNEPIFISVNVSSKQLFSHDLINDVKAALGRSNVVPGSLKLEITESLVMENPEFAVQVLGRIKALGAGLSLDDFGTGYSALSYLQKYPFDTLKVDKSFLADLQHNGNTPVILKAIVSLAHELGMEVVAEGAESRADVEHLRALGCQYVQGYYYGSPLTASDALNYLAQTPGG